MNEKYGIPEFQLLKILIACINERKQQLKDAVSTLDLSESVIIHSQHLEYIRTPNLT
jgi:hypothetical protein